MFWFCPFSVLGLLSLCLYNRNSNRKLGLLQLQQGHKRNVTRSGCRDHRAWYYFNVATIRVTFPERNSVSSAASFANNASISWWKKGGNADLPSAKDFTSTPFVPFSLLGCKGGN
jgi:hypothetical protein